MKNKFNFRLFLESLAGQFQFGSRASRAAILTLMIFASTATGWARPSETGTWTAAGLATSYEFYASTAISATLSGTVCINILPAFEEFPGLENAQLEAVLSGDGATLYVTLSNVSTKELPHYIYLGMIVITDGDTEVTVTVTTDGSGTISTEIDL